MGSYQNKKKRLRKLYGNKCFYCKKDLTKAEATIDHFIPLSKGGSLLKIDNLRLSCKECNTKKGDTIFDLPPSARIASFIASERQEGKEVE